MGLRFTPERRGLITACECAKSRALITILQRFIRNFFSINNLGKFIKTEFYAEFTLKTVVLSN